MPLGNIPSEGKRFKNWGQLLLSKKAEGYSEKQNGIFCINCFHFPKQKKIAWGKKAHQKDWQRSATSRKHLLTCMQLNLLLQKK